MAELAGLVLGGVGVAGVFSVCVQAFEMVEIARSQTRSLQLFATKLDNQKARFIIWGESLDLDKPDQFDKRLDNAAIAKPIGRTCGLVYDLFTDSDQLKTRYGLFEERLGPTKSSVPAPVTSESVWKNTFDRARNRLQQAPQSLEVERKHRVSVTRWVIKDQKAFKELVTDLRELVDDLVSLTNFDGVPERQQKIASAELKNIDNLESLNLLQEATEDDDGLISDIVSVSIEPSPNGPLPVITIGISDVAFDVFWQTFQAYTFEIICERGFMSMLLSVVKVIAGFVGAALLLVGAVEAHRPHRATSSSSQ